MTQRVSSHRDPQISSQLNSTQSVQPEYQVPRLAGRVNLLPIAIGFGVLLIWYAATRNTDGVFLVATPESVLAQYTKTINNGTLFTHLFTTLAEILIGLAIGVTSAFVLGYGIAHSRLLEQAIGPYAVGFQAIPIVAIAPVLIRFFGPGLFSNSIVCALIVFFPMLITTIVAIRNVDSELHALMRSLMATRWQIFTRLEVPAALPVLFGGFKISGTLAVIGAVVGEAVSAQAGLGYLIYAARYTFDLSLVLVGVFTLTALALLLYEFVARIEHYMLRWQRVNRQS